MTDKDKTNYIRLPCDRCGETLHLDDWVCFNYSSAGDYWHKEIRCAKIRSIEFSQYPDSVEVLLNFYESTHDDCLVYPEKYCVKIVDSNSIVFLETIFSQAQKEYKDLQLERGNEVGENELV